jgi:Transposase DDE domain
LAERGLELQAVVADKGHHSGENLAGLEERELVGLISSPNTARGKPGFQRQDFTYDAEHDLFLCPMGVLLRRRQITEGAARQYQARGSDCRACPHFGVCTKSRTGRNVSVPVHEELIQANRERVRSPEWRPLLQIRRQRGEGPFGCFKQFGGLQRFAGRGLDYATKKTLMAAAGWNLLRLMAHEAAKLVVIPVLRWIATGLGALPIGLCRLQTRRCGAKRPRSRVKYSGAPPRPAPRRFPTWPLYPAAASEHEQRVHHRFRGHAVREALLLEPTEESDY